MTSTGERTQCPFCMAHPPLKGDGTMRKHTKGRRGMRRPCPGSGRTKDEARAELIAAKREGRKPALVSDRPDYIAPEEIF